MPFHPEFEEFTEDQIAKKGLGAICGWLLARAMSDKLKHLRDGRPWVIKVQMPQHDPVVDTSATHRINIGIHYFLADPGQAKIGEIVYGPLLTADDKGDGVDRFEATLHKMVFHPVAEGWERVT